MIEPVRRQSKSIRTVIAALAIALLALLAIAGAGLASDEHDQAGLVIYFDADSIEFFLIDLPEDEIDGFELLETTSLDLEVQPFGGLGEGVCSIDGTGCPGSDCFCESYSSPSFFWQYYMWDGSQWVPQHRGARSHTVQPGEIVAWAWTAGPPDLPEVSFADLEELTRHESDPDPDATLAPTSTPGDQANTSTPEAYDHEERSSSNSTQCAQFLGLSALILGIVAVGGARRYRDAEER